MGTLNDEDFLSDRALLRAAEELEEAARLAKGRKRVEPLMRRLELSLRKAFREQGRRFLRRFREEFRSRFSPPAAEAASPHLQGRQIGGERSVWEEYAAGMNRPLKETMTPAEWWFAWYETAKATGKLFGEPIQQAVEKALRIGGAQSLADLGVDISFDLENPRAAAYLKDYGARQVTKIDEETRSQLQTILDQAINDGWSYDRTAKAITDKFEQFSVGSPLEHIDSRAHLVAVTEIGNAYVEANLEVAQELADAGIEMEKAWSTVGDDRVSQEICAPNEAQGWIPLDQAFQSGHMRPLGHPGCRCDLLTRRKSD